MPAAVRGDAVMVERGLHRTIPARAEEIGALRRDVQRYAEELGVADPFAVALAVSETVANAVLHAYVDASAPGQIEVRAEPVDGQLRLIVEDHGRGMMPRADSPGVGLGLPLIAQMTERFEVADCPGGGTQVRMTFSAAG